MTMMRWVSVGVTLLVSLIAFGASQDSRKIRCDTYLQAYMDSHGPSSMPPGEVYGGPAAGGGYSYPEPESDAAPQPQPHSNPLDPVHGKLLLLFKVLLKLLVFKLIVKFIAIICVLFFLPKLSGLGLARAAISTATNKTGSEERLDLTHAVWSALAGPPLFEDRCRHQDSATDTALCRLGRALRFADSHTFGNRLFKVFLKNEKKNVSKKLY